MRPGGTLGAVVDPVVIQAKEPDDVADVIRSGDPALGPPGIGHDRVARDPSLGEQLIPHLPGKREMRDRASVKMTQFDAAMGEHLAVPVIGADGDTGPARYLP